jgi:hypothetical protein
MRNPQGCCHLRSLVFRPCPTAVGQSQLAHITCRITRPPSSADSARAIALARREDHAVHRHALVPL